MLFVHHPTVYRLLHANPGIHSHCLVNITDVFVKRKYTEFSLFFCLLFCSYCCVYCCISTVVSTAVLLLFCLYCCVSTIVSTVV